MQISQSIKFFSLIILLLTGVALSLIFGGSESVISAAGIQSEFIFYKIRIPKTFTAIVAGCSLSVAGLILQLIFRNPLAGPYVLGISSGASLMVALGILSGMGAGWFSAWFIGKSLIVALAVAGSLAVTFLILGISTKVSNNVILLLIGLMISQICGAVQAAFEYFSDPGSLRSFVIWGMGSLGGTNTGDLFLFITLAFLCLSSLFFFVKPMNAFLLGEDYAHNVGINFRRNRFALILISSALTGLTTAFCGPVAFIGIAVPVLSRILFRTSRQQVHIVSCMLIGSNILLYSDALSHSLPGVSALPINVITTFIGAPVVIWLMFRNKLW